ncbi:EutN/CcmL family microcompartment protein [Sporomusa acidovorans]|uniref:Carbon dioxide concentrating mechanism protein CcmL n=1 Tax=Sporomusa acidovorans (strain ATCC 49682 / DSM 3132 / Mol) TaxID=1123286 RepID=A0ABZ3IYX7_SPOA4|nr:EutN/CcmL family microcompartment protein [Sporomusa acidovorans]OZC14138.1 carbon dioxide concentrating mechanism protein CcmL [Sporomusa acidovorans DSM 3132]SDE69312.1 Ethanolamine utilisation protein EutN/carboxysome [Sporomusa acidovorans]
MWVGKIIGTLVATPKDDSLTGSKLLIVQPTRLGAEAPGKPIVAVDTIGAGTGEIVLVVDGSSARHVTGNPHSAVDAAIVGIIDNIEVNKSLLEE